MATYVYNAANTIGRSDEFDPIEEGTYEVTLESATESTTKSGRPVFKVRYRIRSDVDQPFSRRVVFDDLYKAEGDDHYNPRRINSILKAIGGVEDGQTFATIGDIASFIEGGELRVRIVKEQDSYEKSGWRNRIVAFMPTNAKTEVHGFTSESDGVDISDDDLPF